MTTDFSGTVRKPEWHKWQYRDLTPAEQILDNTGYKEIKYWEWEKRAEILEKALVVADDYEREWMSESLEVCKKAPQRVFFLWSDKYVISPEFLTEEQTAEIKSRLENAISLGLEIFVADDQPEAQKFCKIHNIPYKQLWIEKSRFRNLTGFMNCKWALVVWHESVVFGDNPHFARVVVIPQAVKQ